MNPASKGSCRVCVCILRSLHPAGRDSSWSVQADFLGGGEYRLRDTGQGLHRVQAAPRVSRFMNRMLSKLHSQVKGGWQGSSAVHLGDGALKIHFQSSSNCTCH